MRSLTTPQVHSAFNHRNLAAYVAVAAVSLSTFATAGRGEDPGGGTGGTGITITYFDAINTAQDEWYVDGTLQSDDMSIVTITFGGPGAGLTATVDEYGYFFVEVSSSAGAILTMDAADGTSTAYAEVELSEFNL